MYEPDVVVEDASIAAMLAAYPIVDNGEARSRSVSVVVGDTMWICALVVVCPGGLMGLVLRWWVEEAGGATVACWDEVYSDVDDFYARLDADHHLPLPYPMVVAEAVRQAVEEVIDAGDIRDDSYSSVTYILP